MWIADGTQKRTDTGTQHHAQVWTVKRKACVIAEADGKDRNEEMRKFTDRVMVSWRKA
jgi:hypothetical protein